MKRISKTEAIKYIKEADVLEIVLEAIERSSKASSKQVQLNRFVTEVRKQINEERDVILIAVKVK